MYQTELKTFGEALATEQALTSAATQGNKGAVLVGSNLGSLGVSITADTGMTVAAGKVVEVTFQEADEKEGTYTNFMTVRFTAPTGGFKAGAGEHIVRVVPLPDSKPYVKALFSCTDTSASGTFSANMVYLAR